MTGFSAHLMFSRRRPSSMQQCRSSRRSDPTPRELRPDAARDQVMQRCPVAWATDTNTCEVGIVGAVIRMWVGVGLGLRTRWSGRPSRSHRVPFLRAPTAVHLGPGRPRVVGRGARLPIPARTWGLDLVNSGACDR
jgi:hypothetical protein